MTYADLIKLIKRVDSLERSKEIKKSTIDLTGPVPGCYKLGINITNGKLFYRNSENQWQQITFGGSSSLNLQQVTDNGNTTTNDIIIDRSLGRFLIYGLLERVTAELSANSFLVSNNGTGDPSDDILQSSLMLANATNEVRLTHPTNLRSNLRQYLPNTNGVLANSINGKPADSSGSIILAGIPTYVGRIDPLADTPIIESADYEISWVYNTVENLWVGTNSVRPFTERDIPFITLNRDSNFVYAKCFVDLLVDYGTPGKLILQPYDITGTPTPQIAGFACNLTIITLP